MKVTGQHPSKASELSSGKGKKIEPQGGDPRSQEAKGTEQAANRTSLTLNKIKDRIQQTADIREDKVAEIRERIRSGNYTIDADRLASRMIEESLVDSQD